MAASIYIPFCRWDIRSLSTGFLVAAMAALAFLGGSALALKLAAVLCIVGAALVVGNAAARSAAWAQVFASGLLVAATLNSVVAITQVAMPEMRDVPWIASSSTGDVYGNLRQRNQFASLTNIALLAILWMHRGKEAAIGAREAFALIAGAGLMGAMNATSTSRTGAMQLGVMALLLLTAGGWKHRSALTVAIASVSGFVITSLLLVAPGVPFAREPAWSRMVSEPSGCSSRIVLWRNVLDLIVERPWTGWGLGELDYAHYITPYSGVRFCEILDNAHNLPLHIAVELGVPVMLLVLGLTSWVVCRARPWDEQDPTRRFAWGVLGLIAMHSMVEYPLWYGPFILTTAIAAGIVITPHAYPTASTKGSQSLVIARCGLSVSMLVITLLAASDYHRISQIYLPYIERDAKYRDNTLEKIQDSRVFRDQVRFAELATTQITRANAEHVYALSKDMLHFSPEPRAVEQLIASARLTGREQEAAFHEGRFAAAFPRAFAAWQAR